MLFSNILKENAFLSFFFFFFLMWTFFFFLRASLVTQMVDGKESACYRRPRFDPWVEKIPLEKEMATYSSVLAWRSPWLEEPGGLQSTCCRESDRTK